MCKTLTCACNGSAQNHSVYLSTEYWGVIFEGHLSDDNKASFFNTCLRFVLVALYSLTRMTATISFHTYKPPNSHTLAEYNGGLERAILRRELLNDALVTKFLFQASSSGDPI